MRVLSSWLGLLGILALAGLPAPADAQHVGSEFQVNTHTQSSQSGSSAAAAANGNFLVVWDSPRDGSGDGIYGQRYDGAGEPQRSEFEINTYTTNQQSSASLAATGSNEFTVVWTSDDQDGAGEGIFGKRLLFGADSSDVRPRCTAKEQRRRAGAVVSEIAGLPCPGLE